VPQEPSHLVEALAILQGTASLSQVRNPAEFLIYSHGKPDRTPERKQADVLKAALGYLMVGVPSLSPGAASEAALAILRWASGERAAVPDDPSHPGNREVIAYALSAFDWYPVWASLPEAAQTTAAKLLLDHIRRGPEDPVRVPELRWESPFFSALLTAAQQHVFLTYPREVRAEISDSFFRYATRDAEMLESRMIVYLSREHLFRYLSDPQRERIAMWLLLQARSVRMHLGDILVRLSCRHIFRVLSEDERRAAADLLVRYAAQEIRIESSRSMVRVRIEPAAFSLAGLAKGHVFRSLSLPNQSRVASLMLSYATERLPLDPVRPERDQTRETAIKRGLEGLRREWIFNALSAEQKQAAIRILLHHAERGPVHQSADDATRFVYDDTRIGFSGRARRALARPFVRAALSPEDLARLGALGIRPSLS